MSQAKPHAGAGPDGNPVLARAEAENERIARQFLADWSTLSADAICKHLADDCVYLIYEGGPVRRGVAEIHETLTRFMTRWQRIDFIVYRLHVLGELVINERREIYVGKDGHPDWEFNVTGLLRIRNGRIEAWRDYSLPGARQIFS